MADLGDIGNLIVHADLLDAMKVPVVVGQMHGKKLKSQRYSKAFMWYAPNDPMGRGNSFTIPSNKKVLVTFKGRFVNIAQNELGATFYDVASGIYYAYEMDGGATWKVEVTSTDITITPMSSGGGGGTHVSAYVLT